MTETFPAAGPDRRRSERVPLREAVTLCWQEDGQERREHTFTISISRFGCAVVNGAHLRPGTAVTLLHNGNSTHGSVVYNLKDSTRDFIEVGIAFPAAGEQFWEHCF